MQGDMSDLTVCQLGFLWLRLVRLGLGGISVKVNVQAPEGIDPKTLQKIRDLTVWVERSGWTIPHPSE